MAIEFVLLLILLKPTEVFVSIFRKKIHKIPQKSRNFDFVFQDDMFAACKEKPKKPNMPLKKCF